MPSAIRIIYRPKADRLYVSRSQCAIFYGVLFFSNELSTARRIFLALSSGPEFFYVQRKPDETDSNPV